MNTDVILVVGIVVLSLAFPAILGAFAHGRPLRGAAFAVVVGGGLILYANAKNPVGYSIQEIPSLFMRVLSGG
ncbi:MAG: hypothetical protein QNJ35_04210 [Paracoccaceae bacterium]|nr:hypothetical protein [Paracoccaceae bacterium]